MLSADLILKGLGGLAVVGGATTVGVCYQQEKWIFAKKKVETLTLEELAGKVGLSCTPTEGTPTATAGVACNKGTGNIKVKKDSKFELSDLTTNSSGKIKVYKTSTGETYNNNFKFVIEEGDIGTDTNNKLEEFETYEIKNEDNDWRLTKKTSVNDGIKKALGLPEGADCDLPTNTTDEKTCSLDDAKFKKINFEGGGDGRGTVPTGAKLKISKVEDSVTDFGTYKFKFALETTADTKISNSVTIKKGTNTEFKIKANPASGAPKTLTLEKAWSLNELVKKVGLKDCGNGNPTPKECSLDSGKVNLFNESGSYTKGATVKSSDTSKKIKVEENQENHNQGFMFYVTDENDEITLEGGTPTGEGEKKITKKDTTSGSPTYEIKQQTVGDSGTKDWYLSKVTKTQGS